MSLAPYELDQDSFYFRVRKQPIYDLPPLHGFDGASVATMAQAEEQAEPIQAQLDLAPHVETITTTPSAGSEPLFELQGLQAVMILRSDEEETRARWLAEAPERFANTRARLQELFAEPEMQLRSEAATHYACPDVSSDTLADRADVARLKDRFRNRLTQRNGG